MKSKLLIPAAVALMAASAGAWAADDDGAEATIRLMGTAEAELPGAVTKQISLPEDLRLKSNDQAATVDKAKGHEKANERQEKRNAGLSKADRVREQGAEMTEKTKEARENKGRSDERPAPPNRPDNPSRP